MLAVSVSDLIVDATKDAPTSPDGLDEAIGSLLLETQSLTAVEAIAEALGLTLPATDEALSCLERSLPSVGMVLHRLNGDVTIRSQATTDPGARKRLHRKHQARRGLSLTEARVLYRVVQGRIDEGKLSNPDGVALNRLRRAGLVTDDVRPVLTADVNIGLRP